MSDFNFTTQTGTQTLEFGPSYGFTNLNFTADYLSDEISYDFNWGEASTVHSILRGTNNYFVDVWCDPNASLTSGRFYIAGSDSLTIIYNTASTPIVEDYYSTTVTGTAGEALKADDIVDINVGY